VWAERFLDPSTECTFQTWDSFQWAHREQSVDLLWKQHRL
jgi:hypothetical protein